MREHHLRTIDRLIEHFGEDLKFPALIVGGSIARGWDKEDSDVDIVLVASDEEYERRRPTRAYHYWTKDLCDYPGGYVDGKVVNWQFLEEVAERGSEPARAAFVGAWAAYSHLPGLEELLRRITVYPEHERSQKVSSFYAQVQALQWYVGEAEKRNDRYLMTQMVGDLILYGGRMILAHNRILYPYHKWFVNVLREARKKPENLLELVEQLLACPCKQHADRFTECVLTFTDWDKPPEGWASRFMEDTEWAWRRGCMPLADW